MVDELRTNEETAVEKEETMEDMMQQIEVMGDFHRGKVVEGTVVDTRDDGWLVDVGFKCEGMLPRREWTHKVLIEDQPEPQNGDKVTVQITNMGQGDEAQLGLSRWRCEFDKRWNEIEEAAEKDETMTVKGLRKVKGGIIVSCHGIEGFMPISHLAEEGHSVNANRFIDQEFNAKLIEKDRRKRRLVFSRRAIAEQEMSALRETFYENVSVGSILEGDVSSITTFGVFVNLGAIEGLVHISELSWQHNAKAKDLVAKGDHVKVKVIGIDKEANKVQLSIKQTQQDPWETITERCSKGQVRDGVVTNLTDFGAFVEIEPGIEGLVHIADLSWTRIKSPKEVLKKGQQVKVVVLDVDTNRKRISLGYKQLNDPWATAAERYVKDQEVPVKVVRLADFGAFVELEPGIEGLIHISQISSQRIENPKDVLSVGQEVTARVLDVNTNERRIRLTLRSKDEQPAPRKVAAEENKAAAAKSEERPAKRREGGDRKKRQVPAEEQLPQEEAKVTIGDLLKQVQ